MIAFTATLPAMPRKPLPPTEKKTGLSAKVDPRLLSELQTIADADDRTISYMVEKAIRLFVEQARKAHKPRR